jgi:DNA/RNA-binding domain of Phe-tRNA-synthetase-like protein
MQIHVNWSQEASYRFPELAVCIGTITDIHNEKENERIEQLREAVYQEVKTKHNIETLKDNPTVRAFRDFYWKLGIDPTKTRPSGEALLRRVLHGDELPRISAVVDAYNLASTKTILPISGFDVDLLNQPFHVRFAKNGETFTGIGMDKPITLTEQMLVLADQKQVLCIYPYRDTDLTKITMQTRNAMIIVYGVPGIDEQVLKEAAETTLDYIRLVSQGKTGTTKVFSASAQ